MHSEKDVILAVVSFRFIFIFVPMFKTCIINGKFLKIKQTLN